MEDQKTLLTVWLSQAPSSSNVEWRQRESFPRIPLVVCATTQLDFPPPAHSVSVACFANAWVWPLSGVELPHAPEWHCEYLVKSNISCGSTPSYRALLWALGFLDQRPP